MVKTVALALFVLSQALALLVAGAATLWWSSDLMLWLIWLVGEEYALGAENVLRLEDGSSLLTNPIGMIRWTVPFWCLGILQITAALTLVGLWLGRQTSAAPAPALQAHRAE